MIELDQHLHSPLVIALIWAGIIFGLGVAAGAALGWLTSKHRKGIVLCP